MGRKKDTFQRQIFELVKQKTGKKAKLLTIPIEILKFIGDIEAAILLSQLIYWKDRTKNKDGWIFKTYKEWENETGLTKTKLQGARIILEKLNLIETKVARARAVPTVHYRINLPNFSKTFSCFLQNDNQEFSKTKIRKTAKRKAENLQIDQQENSKSLTDSYTESKTDNTTDSYTESTGKEKESVRGKEEDKPEPKSQTYKEQYLKYEAMLKERGFCYTENTLKTINTAVNYYKLSDQQIKKMLNIFGDENQLNYRSINTVAAEISKATSKREEVG